MKEREINEKESIAIITAMIANTRQRLHMGDGNIFLMWGWLTVAVSVLVGVLLYFTHNQAVNWLWFLIWIIGGIITPRMAKKRETSTGVKTYTDKLTSSIWTLVGLAAIGCTLVCLGFMLFAGKDIWSMMFIFALLIVGLVEAVQGMILKERSLVAGGQIGFIAGIVLMGFILAGVPLLMYWVLPLFIAAWVCMMIIPGYALNAKACKEKKR